MNARGGLGASIILASALSALAGQSTSYKLDEYVFNSGGNPIGGAIPSSSGFRVSLDAIGEGIVGPGPSSASFSMDGGFVSAYPPPGEVTDLVFTDKQTIDWDSEKSVGVYNLYRDFISALPGQSYGQCSQSDLASSTATDGDVPPITTGYMFLVTAENRLGEHGTKGFASSSAERLGNLCP